MQNNQALVPYNPPLHNHLAPPSIIPAGSLGNMPVAIRFMYGRPNNRLIHVPDIHTTLSQIDTNHHLATLLANNSDFIEQINRIYQMTLHDIGGSVLSFRYAGGMARIPLSNNPLTNLGNNLALQTFAMQLHTGQTSIQYHCGCFTREFAQWARCNGTHIHVPELQVIFRPREVTRRVQLVIYKYLHEYDAFLEWRTPEFINVRNARFGPEIVLREQEHVGFLIRIQIEQVARDMAELEAILEALLETM